MYIYNYPTWTNYKRIFFHGLRHVNINPAMHHSLTLNTPQRIEVILIANRTSAPQGTDQANKRVLSYAYFRLREIR